MTLDDTRPFPIQAHSRRDETGKMAHYKRSVIPWWLAEEAYSHYAKLFGTSRSLEHLSERGGFGREELLALLRHADL